MGAAAAQVETAYGGAVVGVAGDRAHEEELVEGHVALEDVAVRQGEVALEIERADDLAVQDGRLEVGRVAREDLSHPVAELLLLGVPGPLLQLVRPELAEHRHDVPPRGGDRVVVHGRDDRLQERLRRPAPVLGLVVGALHVVERRADVDGAPVLRTGGPPRQRREVGKLGEGVVDLHRRAARPEALDAARKFGRQVALRVEEPQERHLGVGVRHNRARPHLLPPLQDDPHRAIVLHQDPLDRCRAADDHTALARRLRDALRHLTHAAAHHPPAAAHSVHLPHDVVEQDVGGPGSARPGERSDDRLAAQKRLQLLRLEPRVEEILRAPDQDLDLAEQVLLQAARQPRRLQHAEQIADARRRRVGRRHQQQRLDELRQPVEGGLVRLVHLGVARRELADLPARLRVVVPEHQVAAVGVRLEVRRILRIDDEPVALQVELALDLGAQQADDIRRGRDLVSRPRLLGDRGPPEARPALDDEHLQPAPRQVRRRHEAVVPAADDDDVVHLGHALIPSAPAPASPAPPSPRGDRAAGPSRTPGSASRAPPEDSRCSSGTPW